MVSNTLKPELVVHWKPGRDLLAVFVSWVLVVASLYTATFIISREVWGGMGYFAIYAVLMAAGFGVGLPVYWTVVVRKRPLSDLGFTARWLWLSLGLQLVFSVLQYMGTLGKTGIPDFQSFLPLLALALAIGFFEALFWRGWVLLRLEEAFGILPAILLGSVMYALYHVGYGMPLSEMTFLFFIGILYAATFRLTKNLFILWPVFQPMGQLVTLIKDGLKLPFMASVGFIEALILMFVILWLGARYARKHSIS